MSTPLVVGHWRELACGEQRSMLSRLCGDWLIERGYEADTTWAQPAEARSRPATIAERILDELRAHGDVANLERQSPGCAEGRNSRAAITWY